MINLIHYATTGTVDVVLPYLGKVREERYLVPINELKYTKKDWALFLKDVGLLPIV